MKYVPLLLANLGRKKIRTLLTVGSFLVAFFLFGLLAAIGYGFRQGIDVAGADRLVVIGRTSIIQPLPLSYLPRLLRVPGVVDAAHATWFGGIYQDPKNFFPQFAIVPDDYRRIYPEFVVEEAQWQAFLADRRACVVGAKLAARFGWKVGDKVPLKAPGYLGGGGWDFTIAGIYHGTRPNDDETQFWLRHDYLYEKAPPYWRGIVGWYVVRIANPDDGLSVARAIDEEFGNSSSETRTQTESAFAAAFVRQMGNIEFLIRAVGSIVFFTLLLVTGNTMAIAVRERTNEMAVLKTLGFTGTAILVLVLAESVTIALVGGGLGLWLAHAVTSQDITQGLILLYLPPASLGLGVAFAVATGALAGLLPALGAMRLNVAAALRRV